VRVRARVRVRVHQSFTDVLLVHGRETRQGVFDYVSHHRYWQVLVGPSDLKSGPVWSGLFHFR
jgi:hypothetical protein